MKDYIARIRNFIEFCWSGVWSTSERSRKITFIKVLNLSARSFLDRGLQVRAGSLTYNTLLAIIPALALLFAICRGFGFQNLLQDQLFSYFPTQRKAVETALVFVDKYLSQSSQGIFVGIGILMLLWTLISLLSSIETAFNNIWDIKKDRALYQKVTDYIAICLIIPVLLICSSGASIFMSTVIQTKLNLPFLSEGINILLELSPIVLCWLAFSLSFLLIPNTKVKFKYAMLGGLLSTVGFQIVQWLILSGQIYVTKFNAIYGSFSFLPLLLVWLQLSWLILLTGCAVTYSLQNVFAYNYLGDVSNISYDYKRKVAVVVAAAIAQRFKEGKRALTVPEIANGFELPIRLVTSLIESMHKGKIVSYVVDEGTDYGIAPAFDITGFTAGELFKRLDSEGDDDFIPRFNTLYPELVEKVALWESEAWASAQTLLIEIRLPQQLIGEEKNAEVL